MLLHKIAKIFIRLQGSSYTDIYITVVAVKIGQTVSYWTALAGKSQKVENSFQGASLFITIFED